ncbi:family 17 glycoside hydrolase [Cryphonectria parasitica EP155]|uniref:Family 17 glycoside hydrolase n=1 Tax=Cryphonectria parasitica (strain ATCC 38755 / EP155) TaxID=660469 RepID=A0A9P4Y5G2_CRYP1|nr:family 17 glycoside hydrolase [Cryphonectria parasitica EP155]KAF3766814.1 family 17 glycoside hydrolase [Cryphonectria parasitica EP155]
MASKLLAASALVASTSAAATNYLGFNSGSTALDGSYKVKSTWVEEFTNAANLVGAPGTFNSIRLYTNIQGGTTNSPIEAFDAAVATNTTVLLGIWASGTDSIDNELTALAAGVDALGTDFTNLVIGISIGSEDLYRNSATGVANKAGVGADPSTIVGFINDYKTKFAGTPMADVPIGHVDTWDAFTNSSNSAVIDAVDWLGVDEYPYYQTGDGNTIENAPDLFQKAYDAVVGVAGDKDVWVTETGWAYSGETWDEAVASVANAKTYWDTVGCAKLFNKVPTFWYNFVEDNASNNETFAISDDMSTTARFNLTCPAEDTTTSSSTNTTSSASSSATGASNSTTTGSGSSATSTGTSSGSSGSSSSGSSSSSSASSSSSVTTSGALKLGSSALAAVAVVGAAFSLL